MKEKLLSWGTLICLAVLTCLLLVHTLAIYPGMPAIRWFFAKAAAAIARSDGPAWVQAVGSIVAILAAIGIAWWQRQSDRIATAQKQQADATFMGITVISVLYPLRSSLRSIFKGLTTVDGENAEGRAQRYLMLMKSCEPLSETQMLHLHAVLPKVAEQLARGWGLSRQVMLGLTLINDRSKAAGGEWFASSLKELDPVVHGALMCFDLGARQLSDFLILNSSENGEE